jgi:hypothetical protein
MLNAEFIASSSQRSSVWYKVGEWRWGVEWRTRKLGWTGGEREMYKFFLGNPQGMNELGKFMRRLDDVIKVYVKYMQ